MKGLEGTRRKDIQALRGIAVLGVLMFHAKQSIFSFGYLGVDIFFVISGFVVTPLILRIFPNCEKFDIKEIGRRLRIFYIRRFFRLAPALGVALMFTLLSVNLLAPSWDNRNFPNQAIATLLLVGNWGAFSFVGDYFHGTSNPLTHTWSLSAEEQIYILIPFLILVVSLFARKFRRLSILKIIVSVGVFSFITQFLVQAIFPGLFNLDGDILQGVLFYSPLSRVWEFALGALGFAFSVGKGSAVKVKKGIWSSFLLALFVMATLYFLFSSPSPLLATLSALGVIHFHMLSYLPNLILVPLAWLGDRSYSIYLIHLPLIYIAKNTPLFGDARRQVIIGASLVASILIGSLMFSQVENTFRFGSDVFYITRSKVLRVFSLFVVFPLICFSALNLAISHNYWGMINIKSADGGFPGQERACNSFDSITPCVFDISLRGASYLLIGDSHAQSLSNVFSEIARSKSESYAVWTKGNCPFILRETLQDPKYKEVLATLDTANSKVSCLEHNQEIVDFVHNEAPMRVFASNRNLQGYRSTFSWDISSEVLRNLIVENLRVLANIAENVVYIGPVPEKVYGDVPAHRLLWQLKRSATVDFRITDLPSGPFEDNRFFSNAKLFGNVTFINPIDVFCEGNSCTLGKDYQFYSDAHHLNLTGSEMLRGLLAKTLE